MTLKEKLNNCPHGELIVPRTHIILRSIYQFADSTEVFAFLHCCEQADCSVYFQNEDISMASTGVMNVPEIAVAMYMHMKDNPKIVEDYFRFMLKSSRGEWAIDRVEVIK
jgi:hypothetical protein